VNSLVDQLFQFYVESNKLGDIIETELKKLSRRKFSDIAELEEEKSESENLSKDKNESMFLNGVKDKAEFFSKKASKNSEEIKQIHDNQLYEINDEKNFLIREESLEIVKELARKSQNGIKSPKKKHAFSNSNFSPSAFTLREDNSKKTIRDKYRIELDLGRQSRDRLGIVGVEKSKEVNNIKPDRSMRQVTLPSFKKYQNGLEEKNTPRSSGSSLIKLFGNKMSYQKTVKNNASCFSFNLDQSLKNKAKFVQKPIFEKSNHLNNPKFSLFSGIKLKKDKDFTETTSSLGARKTSEKKESIDNLPN